MADEAPGRPAGDMRVGPLEVLAFGCELAMLAAFAVTGWGWASTTPVRVVLALALPSAVAAFWGVLLAPASRRRLGGTALPATQIGVFLLAGAGLGSVGHPWWAAALVVASVGDVLAVEWRARAAGGRRGSGVSGPA
jgi:Protein of unknown function (DUF2568)